MLSFFGLLGPCLASAQYVSPVVEHQILAARDSVWRAWFANDTGVLRRVLPGAVVAAEGGGNQWADRPAILQQSQSFAKSGARLERIDFANTHIALDGDVALVTSDYRLVTSAGQRTDTSRGHASELFVKQNDRWVNPFWRLGAAQPPGREIPLPDTLGANFSIADSATMHGTPADYDALVGVWEFRFQTRNNNGAFFPAFSGHWTFDKKPGGMLIEDRWRGDNPKLPMDASTYTVRTFDPQAKVWRMVGMSTDGGGEFALGLTWTDGKDRFGIQHYGPAIMRIRYFAIDDNHFLWRADRTVDGGTSWFRDAWTMEARRIAK
jgi:ketosteroid isomerase-like protein